MGRRVRGVDVGASAWMRVPRPLLFRIAWALRHRVGLVMVVVDRVWGCNVAYGLVLVARCFGGMRVRAYSKINEYK